jgi:hypothetical protein
MCPTHYPTSCSYSQYYIVDGMAIAVYLHGVVFSRKCVLPHSVKRIDLHASLIDAPECGWQVYWS